MRYALPRWLPRPARRSRVRSWSPQHALRSDLSVLTIQRQPRYGLRTWTPQRDQLVLLAGALVASILAATVAIVVARRRGARPSSEVVRGAPLRRLRGFVVQFWNPMVLRLGLAGGAQSPWGLIEHVGRVSGHVYRTPISPRAIEGGYEFPLPYGTDVQWVKNVLASGQARVQYHDTIFELEEPVIVEAQDARSVPEIMRAATQRRGYHYLRLHTVAEMPADFAHRDGHRARLTHGETFPMPAEGAFDATFLAPEGVEVPVEPRMVERAASEGEASPAS